MLDINLIREHPELVRDSLQRRYMDAAIVDEILAVDIERRTLIGQVESLKAQRNAVSKEIGRMKNQEERQAKHDIDQAHEERFDDGDEFHLVDGTPRQLKIDEDMVGDGRRFI